MTRGEALQDKSPQIIVDLTLFPTAAGGRQGAISPGYGCQCCVTSAVANSWDGWPLIKEWMQPGETRRVGMFFPSWDHGADELGKVSMFYLKEGANPVGEAKIVAPNSN